MELNPNHPITSAVSDHWHKIVALLMRKFNQPHIEISLVEIEQLASSDVGAVAIRETTEAIVLDLVTWEEAERLAKQEGGLPH